MYKLYDKIQLGYDVIQNSSSNNNLMHQIKEHDLKGFQYYRTQGIQNLKCVQKKSLCELMALHHPPSKIQDVFLAVQMILAGNCSNIEINAATNQAKNATWNGCLRMLLNNVNVFIQSCFNIFQKVGKDNYLDCRIEQAQAFLLKKQITAESVQKYSYASKFIVKWMNAVIQCNKIINKHP